MKILIAYDGSDCGKNAINDLSRAGMPENAEAVVLSAVDVFLPPKENGEDEFPLYVPEGVKLARKHARQAFEESGKLAEQGAASVKQMFPGWMVSHQAEADTPHWAIIAKAEEWKPDLVVLGSHGRWALGRAFLGSVSQKVLYEAACSVRIARKAERAEGSPVRLITAVDGSPDSDAMLEAVAARNWPAKTEVKIITAIETYHHYADDPGTHMKRIEEIQELARQKLDSAGLAVQLLTTEEDPKYSLIREADDWEADTIFLGAKGHRLFERFFLGSVSSSVAARANCSVEVIRKS